MVFKCGWKASLCTHKAWCWILVFSFSHSGCPKQTRSFAASFHETQLERHDPAQTAPIDSAVGFETGTSFPAQHILDQHRNRNRDCRKLLAHFQTRVKPGAMTWCMTTHAATVKVEASDCSMTEFSGHRVPSLCFLLKPS